LRQGWFDKGYYIKGGDKYLTGTNLNGGALTLKTVPDEDLSAFFPKIK